MQIKLLRNEHGIAEWMAIEMQGQFEFESETATSGRKLGQFAWLSATSACMAVGHQLLEGELKELERPFLIINKATMRDDGVGAEGTQHTDDNAKTSDNKIVDVVGVIKRKVIFKERPKPIIASAM